MIISFLSRQIGLVVLLTVTFIVVMVLAVGIGLDRSLESWQEEQGISFHDFLRAELGAAYRREGHREGEAIDEYLRPYLDPTLYVFVFDIQRELVFWYWRGDSWYREGEAADRLRNARAEAELIARIGDSRLVPRLGSAAPHRDPELFATLETNGRLQPIEVGARQVGYFAAGSSGFTVNRTNKRLIDSLLVAVAVGVVAALVVGVLVTLLWSRSVNEDIRTITAAIARVATGGRREAFPTTRIKELKSICESGALLQAQLVSEERLRRQWAMDIAHDLKTPIADLRAQLEGIADGVLQPDARRIQLLLSELARMESLSGDMLLVSRVESPELTLRTCQVRLSELATTIRERFGDRATAQGRALEVTAGAGTVRCDAEYLLRALSNLVENALRHGTGPIVCRLDRRSIEISNDGTIPQDDLPYLFDRLYRIARDRSSHGHGLGLSIAKAIVEKHGWTIDLSSDRGTVRARIILDPQLRQSPAAPLPAAHTQAAT